jgi:hypothetical protein
MNGNRNARRTINMIHSTPQKSATGQARNQRRIAQRTAKIGLDAMLIFFEVRLY